MTDSIRDKIHQYQQMTATVRETKLTEQAIRNIEWELFSAERIERPDWARIGQWTHICAHKWWPEIVDDICRDDQKDPFFVDTRLPVFLLELRSRVLNQGPPRE